jgi:hypothetical protein
MVIEKGDLMDSILTSIKKLLGIEESAEHFDADIIMYINMVFSILNHLGVGPETPFSISDKEAEWSDFISDNPKIESVKTYVYMKVKLIFDPPASSAAMTAMNNLISELEFRLHVICDPPLIVEEEVTG